MRVKVFSACLASIVFVVLPTSHTQPISIVLKFSPVRLAWIQASASTWLLNLSLSPMLKPTSEGKLNILRAVCWCLYLIKCADEVLIYRWAVFTLYYKEITQPEWDQAGNTVSRFYNLMAKRKREPWWRGRGLLGDGRWLKRKHDNIQEGVISFRHRCFCVNK